jgi:DNA-binding GntR family transcriptional regulator
MDSVPLRPQTAEQYVYAYLRDSILSGKLRGGDRIDQEKTARELVVSRMPVREAIRRLDSEGLVVHQPHRGVLVTVLGPEAVLELFEMRSVLEGLATSLAVKSITEESLTALEAQLEQMDHVRKNPAAWLQRHDDFHEQICTLARRPRLAKEIRRLRQSVTPYIRLYLAAYGDVEMPGSEHRALLDAIRHRDPQTAERTIRKHIMSAARGVIEFLKTTTPGKRSD